jgi:hypothetical protein
MARLVVASTGKSQIVDDTDGSMPAETITFGLDGTIYAIDLSEANAEQLRSALEDYINCSRIVGHYSDSD